MALPQPAGAALLAAAGGPLGFPGRRAPPGRLLRAVPELRPLRGPAALPAARGRPPRARPGPLRPGAARAEPRRGPAGRAFTQEELHFVLYGAAPHPEPRVRRHHARSGRPAPAESSGPDHLPPALDNDSLQLPEGLCIMQTMVGSIPRVGVFCSNFIAKGIRFGPFQGKVVNASEVKTHRDNSLMWEIFEDGHLSHFVDGKGTGHWMSYVNCARFPKEQNLMAVQYHGQIFYESCKEVYQNQELLVWYGNCYEKFLDIPVSLHAPEQGQQPAGRSEESAEGYRCERCGKVFTYRYYRDKHLKYTPCVDRGDRKFPCSLCKRSFEKRDRLRIHVLHVHEKHRPYLCSICGKCFSQSSSLNKHMRVHSGDRPYQCVYCTKKFTASSILRTHLRQHSGEKPFKCKHCGKPFASHAAHDSHVRRSHKEGGEGGPCHLCGASSPEPRRPGQRRPRPSRALALRPGTQTPGVLGRKTSPFPRPGAAPRHPDSRRPGQEDLAVPAPWRCAPAPRLPASWAGRPRRSRALALRPGTQTPGVRGSGDLALPASWRCAPAPRAPASWAGRPRRSRALALRPGTQSPASWRGWTRGWTRPWLVLAETLCTAAREDEPTQEERKCREVGAEEESEGPAGPRTPGRTDALPRHWEALRRV
ncbi:PR domain zinc finger protein 14 [Perognathus longimembris pacificus]|uniref:PR domain zinc finger protein 14 n=1 Tax=Perognathus longimembris pacificus TaxID=214514 RepID=UPI002019EEF9|nr:PR domain zinc finger protein 14 [Perognathus longimembris pacificus]